MMELETLDVTLICVIMVVIIAVVLFLNCWKKVGADKALVITGLKKRVLSGAGGFMIPFIETSCIISLENIKMTTDVLEAPSKQGIFVNVVGTAVVKIRNEKNSILHAVEQFCEGGPKYTVANISQTVEQILEGKLRGIVSTLTVEQINEDRTMFEQKVEDDIRAELDKMGLDLVSYSILKISTQGNYLENRAIPQIARAKSDADIASAERKRDTEIKTAQAEREGQKARLEADALIAEAERDKRLKVELYRSEQDRAKADADIAYGLQEIENQSRVEKEKAALAEQAAIRVEKELIAQVVKPADAQKQKMIIDAEAEKIKSIKIAEAQAEKIRIEAIANAEARKIQAEAEAESIRITGQAEAEAIKARGLAEALAKDKLADAMAKYGNAAVTELIINKLPEIMLNVAKPMESIDKITIIDNGGNEGASKVGKVVTDIAGNGFQLIKDLTGFDISETLNKVGKESEKQFSSENLKNLIKEMAIIQPENKQED